MRDDPARSRSETDEGIQRWSRRGFHVQHWYNLIAMAQTELYLRHGPAAYDLIRDRWPELRRSGVFHIQHTRIAAYTCALALRWPLRNSRTAGSGPDT